MRLEQWSMAALAAFVFGGCAVDGPERGGFGVSAGPEGIPEPSVEETPDAGATAGTGGSNDDAGSGSEELDTALGEPDTALGEPGADAGDDAGSVEPPNDTGPAPDVSGPGTVLACGDAPLWWQQNPGAHTDTAPLFDFSPNGALLLRAGGFGGDVFHTADGAWAGSVSQGLSNGSVADFSLVAGPQAYEGRVDVSLLGSDAPLFSVLPPPPDDEDWYHGGFAAITPDASRIVALSCWTRYDGDVKTQTLRLTAWEAAVYDWMSLLLDVEIKNDDDCAATMMLAHRNLRLLPDGSGALVVSPTTGHLRHVNLDTGEVHEAPFLPGPPAITEPPLAYLYHSRYLALELSPKGDMAAIVSEDGLLRLVTLPELTLVGEPLPVLVGVANACTYVPTTESPAAFSDDGALLAHAGDNGSVVIRALPGLEVKETLEVPAGAGMCDGTYDLRPPQAIRFSRDGAKVAVGYEHGVALWGCGAPEPDPILPLDPVVTGPVTLAAGEEAAYTLVDVMAGSTTVTVKQWRVDGEPVGGWTLTSRIERTFEPGAHTIEVDVDDGHKTATATLLVTVE